MQSNSTTAHSKRALVSIDEARAYLGGIGLTMTYELIKRGELTKVNIGRRGFVTRRSLEAYVERLEAAAASDASVA